MRLNHQQKANFFRELGQAIKAGRTLSQAIERRATSGIGVSKKIARELAKVPRGESAITVFSSIADAFSILDLEMVAGGESAGDLDGAFIALADYYDLLARSRRRLISALVYPIFLMNFGAVVLSAPAAVQGGMEGFLKELGIFLGAFYAALLLVGGFAWILVALAQSGPKLDQISHRLPLFGSLRVALAGSRFASVFAMLVQAGVGILTGIERAAAASGSPAYRSAAAKIVADVRNGESLTLSVLDTHTFPEPIERAFDSGEESGRLDETMLQAAATLREQLESHLAALTTWLPKLIYILIVLALAWKIFQIVAAYYQQISDLMP